MKRMLVSVTAALMLCLSMQASALLLSLEPDAQPAVPGDSVMLNLVASEFGTVGLGGFDLELSYDMSALIFDGYTLGAGLGDLSLFEAIDYSAGDIGGGLINLTELSLLPAIDLLALQGTGPITLATLGFTVAVLAGGDSTFVDVGTVHSIADALGTAVTTVTTAGAEIGNVSTPVPVPGTLMLFALGLLGLGARRWLAAAI